MSGLLLRPQGTPPRVRFLTCCRVRFRGRRRRAGVESMAAPAARPAGGRGGRSHEREERSTTFASTAPRRIAVASADGATPLTTLARIGAAGEPSTWQHPRLHRSRGTTSELPAHWHREVAGKAHRRCPLPMVSRRTVAVEPGAGCPWPCMAVGGGRQSLYRWLRAHRYQAGVRYPENLAQMLNVEDVNASCPGEASGGFISLAGTDNGCRRFRAAAPLHVQYSTSQLDLATSFLRSKPRTSLVTIDI